MCWWLDGTDPAKMMQCMHACASAGCGRQTGEKEKMCLPDRCESGRIQNADKGMCVYLQFVFTRVLKSKST